jgi:hypothetical protein
MSTYSFYLPLLLAAIFGRVGPGLAARLPPRLAAWLMTAGGLTLAAASSASLALLAFIAAGQLPFIAAFGCWSDDLVRQRSPLSGAVGTAAAGLVLILAAQCLGIGLKRLQATRGSYRLASELPRHGRELSLLETDARLAYAVPGRPGCIVVSRGMLRELDAAQRRALLTHERAHLDHHHHLHQTAACLVGAVNPFLCSLRASVELACERWADEEAAQVCPRGVVAEALTRAAIGGPGATPGIALRAAATAVLLRVRALQSAEQRLRLWPLLAMGVFFIGSVTSAVVAWRETEGLFEIAQHAYQLGRR